jgi:UDP-N-acetylglucosamine:LPS N-acetylglucosamine transferase
MHDALTGRTPVNILLVYANTGGGHLSAARAIEAAILERYPGEASVSIVDIPVASGSREICLLYDSYNTMLKADPRFAKHGMALLNAVNIEQMVIPMAPRAFHNIRKTLLRARPDIVVSVHPILNHAMMRALKETRLLGRVPYVIVCTDLTDHFLRGWANPAADELIVFSEAARRQMQTFGVPDERIRTINGFPVNPAFARQAFAREECRRELGLDDGPTALVMMGGMAVPGKTIAAVRALQAADLPLQTLVVCGMNRTLKRKMHFLARGTRQRIRVYGFTRRVPQMMGAADFMVAKPGPGTIMEALIAETPLFLDHVTAPMPQESGNLRFAVEQGIARAFTSYRDLTVLAREAVEQPGTLDAMTARMRAIRNPDGVFEIADALLSHVRERV